MNVASHVENIAILSPARTAILFEGRSLSYGELDRQARQLAAALDRVGVRPGDRVALFLPNIPEFAVAYLAAQKLGAVVVSMNAMLKADEAAYVLRDSGAIALFTTEALLEQIAPVRAQLPGLRHLVLCEGQAVGAVPLAALLEAGADFASRAMNGGDPAAILYTSGTTGRPKGAVLTHGNVISNYLATIRCVGSVTGDRHLLFVPLYHCFGQNFIMNAVFGSAGTIVLQRRYDREVTLAAVRELGVTHFYGVPTIYIYLLAAGVGPAELASVRYFFSAAATMPREVAHTWRERFGSPIYEGYGLTETSPFAAYNHAGNYRLGSVGVPIDGVEMKVVDETGSSLPAEQQGEICIKGPNVMAGYFGRAEETQAVLRDGWFHSGDIGYRDEDGYYFLVDRLKDMINCAGFKVWPREVEEVLYQHPAVAECAVVGAADPVKGEKVRAFVRLKAGARPQAELLRVHCEERLARYKVPCELVFDREIPKSPAGKILKRVLRD
jgi:long-chain acyl-CoA synthetase